MKIVVKVVKDVAEVQGKIVEKVEEKEPVTIRTGEPLVIHSEGGSRIVLSSPSKGTIAIKLYPVRLMKKLRELEHR